MLNIDTLLLTGLFLAVSLALGLGAFRDRRSDRSMRIWRLAVTVQAVFWLLFYFGRGLPPPISMVLVNTLAVVAMAGYLHAMRVFLGRPLRTLAIVMLVAATAIGNIWFGLVAPSYEARVVAVSLPGAVLMFWLCHDVLRHRETATARAARVTALVFAVGGASLLLRVVDASIHPGRPPQDSLPQQVALLIYATLPIFASLGFLLMQASRGSAALVELARTDPLTGAYNRRAFESAARAALAGCLRTGRPASLLLIDVDHFKQINDSLGHEAGDQVLVALRECLDEALRQEDVVARLGGEEFVVLLPGAGREAATSVAERLRARIANLVHWDDRLRAPMTVSIGVAEWERSESSLEPLLRRADDAMYAAKRAGRNRVVAAEPVLTAGEA